MYRFGDKFAYREAVEDRKALTNAKIDLFHALISINPNLLTEREVDVGLLLLKDPDIQRRLEGGPEKQRCFPRKEKGESNENHI